MFKKLITILTLLVLTVTMTACSEVKSSQIELENSETGQAIILENGENTVIEEGGSYTFTGSSNESQIIVDVAEEDVEIILDNVSLESSISSPIIVENAKNVDIILAEDSENFIKDNRNYDENSDADIANAAIYSTSDLKIKGEDNSSLTIIANYRDGINSKDDLKIKDANIEITANDDGMRGKDSVEIKDSFIKIDAEDDGVKSDNDEDAEKAIITIEDTTLEISAGDDAIHAGKLVEILSGNINILDSYEGIEAEVVDIYDGVVVVNASDDGIGTTLMDDGTKDASENPEEEFGGRPPMGNMPDLDNMTDEEIQVEMKNKMGDHGAQEGVELNIYGGEITVNAAGDGIDSNGNIYIYDGLLTVNGLALDRDSALDANGVLEIDGGTVIAVGSTALVKVPDETSTQNSIHLNLDEQYSADTLISIKDESGVEILNYIPIEAFQAITFSSEAITLDTDYTLYLDGKEILTITTETVSTVYGESTGPDMDKMGKNQSVADDIPENIIENSERSEF